MRTLTTTLQIQHYQIVKVSLFSKKKKQYTVAIRVHFVEMPPGAI